MFIMVFLCYSITWLHLPFLIIIIFKCVYGGSLILENRRLQMRLNKVSELIHNSTNHQNLDSAGVSVHFQEIVDLVIFLGHFLGLSI